MRVWNDSRMIPIAPVVTIPINAPTVQVYSQFQAIHAQEVQKKDSLVHITIPDVPFYSQFQDITSSKWQKVGCGIASLAMIIEYYKPDTVSVDKLLGQAVASGAYQKDAGWIHKGLVLLSQKYGLDGTSYDLSKSGMKTAFNTLKTHTKDGPVMVSVHYKFDPKSTIPHLVVIDGIDGDVVYYNDPASNEGGQQISTTQFLKAWKKKFIVVRPTKENRNIATNMAPSIVKEKIPVIDLISGWVKKFIVVGFVKEDERMPTVLALNGAIKKFLPSEQT